MNSEQLADSAAPYRLQNTTKEYNAVQYNTVHTVQYNVAQVSWTL